MNKELVEQITTLLVECGYEELKVIYKALTMFKEKLDEHYLKQIDVGDIVPFEYEGQMYRGKVLRVNIKTVTLKDHNFSRSPTIRVPVNMVLKGVQKMMKISEVKT